jgi:hypothetical protein
VSPWPTTLPTEVCDAEPTVPIITGVTGGAHGMTVAYEHALALAADYDVAADRMRDWAGHCGRVLLDADLLESALLSPLSFAEAEAAVLAATSGPDGVLVAAAVWEADAVTIRVAVRATQLTDELVVQTWEGLVVPDTGSAAGFLAAFYPEGHPLVTPTALDVPGSNTLPADLAGLLQHLAEVNALPDPGTVEVQTIRSPDGSIRHVVYLPGTDELATTPWSQDGDVRDLGTNLLLVSGQDNAYQQGVLDAMQQAGIGPDEPVALVGHSQGGMVAAAIASQGSPYSVTHVVTAGSPTAHLDGFPPGLQALSLENHGDVVPLLDGADNPDSAEQVTVRFDDGVASIVGDHELDSYVEGAVVVQASDDASIRDQLESLVQAGFVGSPSGQEVTGTVFQITRDPS